MVRDQGLFFTERLGVDCRCDDVYFQSPGVAKRLLDTVELKGLVRDASPSAATGVPVVQTVKTGRRVQQMDGKGRNMLGSLARSAAMQLLHELPREMPHMCFTLK